MANKHLYGTALSSAIRQAIKEAGIKGTYVRVERFSLGQEIIVSVKASENDFVSLEDYIKEHDASNPDMCGPWIVTETKNIHKDDFYGMPIETQAKIAEEAARRSYGIFSGGTDKSGWQAVSRTASHASYPIGNKAFNQKLNRINEIVMEFHYDNSDSTVDYFDTNFYFYMKVKVA